MASMAAMAAHVGQGVVVVGASAAPVLFVHRYFRLPANPEVVGPVEAAAPVFQD